MFFLHKNGGTLHVLPMMLSNLSKTSPGVEKTCSDHLLQWLSMGDSNWSLRECTKNTSSNRYIEHKTAFCLLTGLTDFSEYHCRTQRPASQIMLNCIALDKMQFCVHYTSSNSSGQTKIVLKILLMGPSFLSSLPDSCTYILTKLFLVQPTLSCMSSVQCFFSLSPSTGSEHSVSSHTFGGST